MNDGETQFWDTAQSYLTRPGVTRGTMMGFPCLRRDDAFFACAHRNGESMIIKVQAERVTSLIAQGLAESFAPNGRVFREWAAIPIDRRDTWPERLAEAWAFAAA